MSGIDSSFFIGKYVIVRTPLAGVWAGTLRSKVLGAEQVEVVLDQPRRMYSWKAKQSITLSACAAFGIDPKESKVITGTGPISVPAVEVLAVTPEAQASILGTPDPKGFVHLGALNFGTSSPETVEHDGPLLEQLYDGGYALAFSRENNGEYPLGDRRYSSYIWIGRLRSRAGYAVVMSDARRLYPDLYRQVENCPDEITAFLHKVTESGGLKNAPCPAVAQAIIYADTVLPMTKEAYEKVMAMPDAEAKR